MRFAINMECANGYQVVKSFGDDKGAREFIEGFCLDDEISDESWKQLLMGEKLKFFGDRTIEVELMEQ